jgi:hypothetical protein
VFPGVIIRVCQFHVMQVSERRVHSRAHLTNGNTQAILRWERDNTPAGEGHGRVPALSLTRKHQLLWAVREIQRCRDPARWPTYLEQFRARLDAITRGSRVSSQTLWQYFEANWFCEEWRGKSIYQG